MEDSSKWGNDMQQKVRQHDDAKRFGRSIEDGASRDGWGRDGSSKNNLVSARDEAKNAENVSIIMHKQDLCHIIANGKQRK
jgi:hypothetical protein